MEFRLLGEVELRAGGQRLDVGTPRQQAVLAGLVVDAGRPVAIETLIDRVWDDAPPVEARNVLYSHLSRIRRLLRQAAEGSGAAARIERRHAGYVLDVDPDLVDLHRFRRLVEQGRDPRRADAERADALADALRLWRGAPLAGIPGGWVAQVRRSWHRRRLDAAVQWADLELRLGHSHAVVTTVPDLVAEYPLAEPLEGVLMRALHAAGRSAEALDRYTAVRQRLADELGTDPGGELRALYQAILRDEELPHPPAEQVVVTAGRMATPAQLPPDTSGFVGRDLELRQLDELLVRTAEGSPRSVVVVVSGTAGVGKTVLALHWAHRVRDEFPDGQLYVNLQGFDPTGTPAAPAEAVRGFLAAFEVAPERIPAGLEAQVGLYRSLLAGRRVLVVLDNARDAEHARPLLPGASGCRTVVTSRNQLSGLIAEGADPLTLDLLSPAEAHELLARRLGARRMSAEPAAAENIVNLCARLPLALSIVAARAAIHPEFALSALAAELSDASGGLDEFAGGDPATDARTVFSWSYQQLGEPAARLFRLLGVHPGPEVSLRGVASLAGISVRAARQCVAELTRAHLLAERLPGRYVFHDLLWAYAAEQTLDLDSEAERAAATRRMLSHYVFSADAADRLLNPRRDSPPAPPEPASGVSLAPMADRQEALAWFDAEHAVLLATVRQATGFDPEVWHLAWTLRRFLAYQGHWHDSIVVLTAALNAARRLADPAKQAFAHCFLGCAHLRFARYEQASTQLQAALEQYRVAGDPVGEADVHHYQSWALERQGRHREALSHAERARDLFHAAGHRVGEAKVLNAIGWFQAMLGDYQQALVHCGQALALQTALNDPLGLAETLHSIGYAHKQLGDHVPAVEYHRMAVDLFHEHGYRYNEAQVLTSLGDTEHAAGDPTSARAAWQKALDLLEQLDHADADEVRTRLKENSAP